MSDQPIFKPTRRILIKGLVSASGTAMLGSHMGEVLAQGVAPAAVTSERLRPQLPGGVMSGDITADSAIVWSRTDRPARMIVEYSTDAAFKNVARRVGPAALESNGLTARVDLTGLPAGADLFYRVRFQD
ncbi:alkaline phosphatase, partial [Escherichia coli]|uniref:PhoD-like phosphatase N-terminal domain-containing protein n=4 Tax=Pseudomonadota TaxID=1224 RepID=UPI00137D702A